MGIDFSPDASACSVAAPRSGKKPDLRQRKFPSRPSNGNRITPVEARLLDRWATDTIANLGSKGEKERVIAEHLSRQINNLKEHAVTQWFIRNPSVSREVASAAIAGSDITKCSPGETERRAKELLTLRGSLPYGKVFDKWDVLACVYMHAAAGEHFAQIELPKYLNNRLRRGNERVSLNRANAIAERVCLAIRGHDSFNGVGFGEKRLKPALAAQLDEKQLANFYPNSSTPEAIITEITDRLDALTWETMKRYAKERYEYYKDKPEAERTYLALKEGVFENIQNFTDYISSIQNNIARVCSKNTRLKRELLAFPLLSKMVEEHKQIRETCSQVLLVRENTAYEKRSGRDTKLKDLDALFSVIDGLNSQSAKPATAA